MDKNKISRNHPCNIHTDQQLISICLHPNCYRPVLCLECIKDADIHSPDHNTIESLEDFFLKVDSFEARKSGSTTSVGDKQALTFLKATAEKYEASIETVKTNIEAEKKIVEKSMDELISSLMVRCQAIKQDIFQKLDAQVRIFAKNYKKFVKLVKRLPTDQDNGKRPTTSSFERLDKAATYTQIDDLVKKHRKEMAFQGSALKDTDDHLLRLKSVAQTLRDQISSSCSTILSTSDLEVVKTNIGVDLERSFAKYLKLQKENFPLEGSILQSESKIIKDSKLFALLQTFLKEDYKEPTLDLIYRGSRDGMTSESFTKKCGKKGPTLLIIRSKQGKRFGGYTEVDWVDDEQYKKSKKSFLFSLDYQEKYYLKVGHDEKAVKGSKTLGPCFGAGHDLRLSKNFKFEESSGYIGFSYESKQRSSRDIFGGSTFFVDEIEVYRVLEEADVDENNALLIQEGKRKLSISDDEYLDDWIEINKDSDNEEEIISSKADNENSNLVTPGELETLMNWIDPKKNFTLELLYRGCRDGFNSENFHKKCDNKGPTLTLVKSKKYEQVFGGFTKHSWNTSNQPAKCNDTFVFSVTKKKKFTALDADNAIFRSNTAGPVFGSGDIFICSGCDKKAESYSNLGVGFDSSSLKDSFAFFANEQYFVVEDIEVFQVVFKK